MKPRRRRRPNEGRAGARLSAAEPLQRPSSQRVAPLDLLLRSGVFDRELIDSWIETKRGEVRELRARPTPYEYELYFDG